MIYIIDDLHTICYNIVIVFLDSAVHVNLNILERLGNEKGLLL